MACINRSHPEFKTLAAKSKINPTVLAANIAVWMEQNNTTLFPTIEELEAINKPEEKYFSYSPIKQLGFKYNTNTAGFMPSNVPLFQVKKDAERLGLSVHKAKSGNWYFKNQRGQFVNPHKYQVESQESRLPEAELNDKLKKWADTHGIKVEAVEEMVSRLGSESRYQGVVAVADFLNKVISVDPSKEKIDTLAEEISHFATAILKDDISVKKALEKITDTEIYKQVKEDYADLYSREEDFKKEAMDKLLAQSIVKEFQTEQETKGIMPYLKAIFNKFWRWVNKNLKRTNAETQIKNDLYPLAKRVLAGDYMGTIETSVEAVPQQQEFFQQEEESKEPEKDSDIKTEIEIAQEFLEKATVQLSDRISRLEQHSEGDKDVQISELQREIDTIQKSIRNEEFRAGILGVIDLAKKELGQIKKVLDKHIEKGIINSNTYRDADEFIEGYAKLFAKLRENMSYYPFNAKLKQQMIEAMSEVKREMDAVSIDNKVLITKAFEARLEKANTNSSGEKIDPNFNPKKAARDVSTDISSWRLWVGNWKQASSSLLRNAWKIVQEANLKVKRVAIDKAHELKQAQVMMEKEGFRQSDLVAWETDNQGKKKKASQFLIRQADWANHLAALEKHRQKLVKEFDYPSWESLKEDVVDKNLSEEKLKRFEELQEKFKEDHPTQPIYDNQGNVIGYEPVARNSRYNELMKNKAVKNYYNLLIQTKEEALNKLPKKYRTDTFKYMIPGIRGQFIEKLFRPDVPFTENIKQIFHESVFRDQDDTEFGQVSELGNKMVPIYFNQRFENTKELSTDLTRSFTIYAEMAENFYQKNKIAGDMWAIQNKVADKNYTGTLRKNKISEGAASNEYKAITTLLDSHIYGQTDLDYTFKIPESKLTKKLGLNNKEFSITKAVSKLTSYIRTNNLALSPFTSIAGHIKGTIDSILEDQLGRYSTVESKNWARLEYSKNITEVLRDLNKKSQSNKMNLLVQRNNVVELNSILRNTERSNLTAQMATSSNLYINYKLADYPIKSRIMLAIYDNNRLVGDKFIDKEDFRSMRRKEGISEKEINKEWKTYKDKSYYNAFEVVDNKIKIKKEFKPYINDKLENKITSRIEHVSNNVDGVMSQEDKGALSRQIMGAFLLMHRGWLINMIDSRFMSRNVNPLTEKEDMGYYTAIWDFMKHDMFGDGIVNSYKALSMSHWRKLREEDPAKAKGLKRAMLDLLYLNILGLLAGIVNAAADDADDEDYTMQFAAFQLNRALLEQASGNPLLKPLEMLQIIEKPVVGVNTIQELIDITEMWNTSDIYERGMYAGRSHAEKWWIRRTPFRSLYEAQFPQEKNKFMKIVLNSTMYNLLKDEDEDIGLYKRFKAILQSDSNISSEQAMQQALSTY